jgi:hypothetical protein
MHEHARRVHRDDGKGLVRESAIGFDNSYVALGSVSKQHMGCLISRAVVSGMGTFDTVEFDNHDPFAKTQLKNRRWYTSNKHAAPGGFERRP